MDKGNLNEKFSYYEKRLIVLLVLSVIPNAFAAFQVLITQYEPPFQCVDDKFNFTKVDEFDTLHNETSYTSLCERNVSENRSTDASCTNYDFYGPAVSMVTEFNLVCDRAWLRPLMTSIYMVGKLTGGLVGGTLSDRFGRKPIFLIFTAWQFVSAILLSFSSSVATYGFLMFVSGCGSLVNYMAAVIIGTEFVSPKRRTLVMAFITLGSGGGYIILPGLGYWLQDWRWFLRFTGVIGVLYVPYYWLIDETPLWLLSRGSADKVSKVLEKIAKINGAKVEEKALEKLHEKVVDKTKVFGMWRTCRILLGNRTSIFRILVIFFSWFVTSMVYYAIALGTNQLSGNRFANMAYAGIAEALSGLAYYFIAANQGQRNGYILSSLFCGFCVIANIFLEMWSAKAVVVSTIVGRLINNVAFQIVYIYTGELFPTNVRHSVLAMSSGFSRIGGVIAPYIIFAGETGYSIPALIFMSGVVILSAIFYIFLPAQTDGKLPNNVDETLELKSTGLFCCKPHTNSIGNNLNEETENVQLFEAVM